MVTLVDLPFAIVNCLGWYPRMTHVFSSSAKTLFFDALMNWIYNQHMHTFHQLKHSCLHVGEYVNTYFMVHCTCRASERQTWGYVIRATYFGHVSYSKHQTLSAPVIRIAEMYVDAVLVKFLLKKIVLNFLVLRFYPPNKRSKNMIFLCHPLGQIWWDSFSSSKTTEFST